mmetsp:Transcript_22466/g.16969  ORF Transcript_22466/g.16969 Transcript_22466/m.16969 type:complete len:160 (+) Transcript_22466:472-951(+)
MQYFNRLTLIYQDEHNCVFLDTNRTSGSMMKFIDSSCEAMNVREVFVMDEKIVHTENLTVTKKMIRSNEESVTISKEFNCEEVETTSVMYEYCATIIVKAERQSEVAREVSPQKVFNVSTANFTINKTSLNKTDQIRYINKSSLELEEETVIINKTSLD